MKNWVVPPEGSDDWLWYHPEPAESYSWRWADLSEEEYYKSFKHDPCEVTFTALITPTNRIQCWACGKFLRKPKFK